MFRILALAVLLLFGASGATAQAQRRSADERAQRFTELQHNKVGLSDEQKSQLLEINRKAFIATDSARAANAGNRQAIMSALRDINQARDASTLALLTDEQKPKYEAAREEFRAYMRQRMQEGRGRGR